MPWGKLDDGFWSHPKVLEAGNEAAGVFARSISWSSAQMTDGFITDKALAMIAGTRKNAVARVLVEAGLFDHQPGPDGAHGWWVHDFLTYNPSRELVLAERAHRAEKRDPKVTAAVRARDGDGCRYCGQTVNWRDKRGPRGGTYDQVIPGIAGGVANLVVACRGCNSQKGRRSLEDAGMSLLPAPALDSSPIQVRSKSEIEPDPVLEGDAPGRVGAGRVGSGARSEGPAPAEPPTGGDQ